MTVRYLFCYILLLLPAVSVGCSGEIAPTSNGVAAEKSTAGDDGDESASGQTNASADEGNVEQFEETSPEELLTQFPVNQFECRAHIIALAKEIKRLTEASSKTDEEQFADYSIYFYRMAESIGFLQQHCRSDKERLMHQRLNFLIALHQPVVQSELKGEIENIRKSMIADAKREAQSDGREFTDEEEASINELVRTSKYWHGRLLMHILREKKPDFLDRFGEKGQGDFSFHVMYCGIDHSESDPVDYCPKIARLALPADGPDPISFCADYVETFYTKVIEPRQVFEDLSRLLNGEALQKQVEEFSGKDFEVMLPFRGDADQAEKIIALVEKHRPDNAKALSAWRTKVRRRLLQQVQESAKHQLVLVQRAQEEFRNNDADRNGVKDYWVADVSGLYRLTRADNEPIDLIDVGIASIDAAPLPNATDGCGDLERDSRKSVYNNFPYRLQMIRRNEAGGDVGVATDATGRKWFNNDQFALCAYPIDYPKHGRNTYLIDESGQLWMRDTQGKPVVQRPADYEADGWSKTKITPKYENRVEVDYGGFKVQQRIMHPRQQLLSEIQLREKLRKSGVLENRGKGEP